MHRWLIVGSLLVCLGMAAVGCEAGSEIAALEERVAALEEKPTPLEDLLVVERSNYQVGHPWFVVYYRQANGQIARWLWESEPGVEIEAGEEIWDCYMLAFEGYQLPDCMRE